MKDTDKSKEELISELAALRRRLSALEASVENCRRNEAELRDELAARKLAEVEIRRNEAQLSQVAANIPGVVYQLLQKKDGSQRFPYISEGCYALFGLSPEEIKADSARLFALIPPEDAARVQQASQESARTMAGFRVDHRVCKPDGTVVWLRVRSTPQRLPNGDTLWHGVAINITEQKQMEEAWGESESRYRRLFENAGVSLWEQDFSEVKRYIDQLREAGIKDIGRFFEHHWQAVIACASKVKILDVNEAGLRLYRARQKAQLLKSLKEVLTEESIPGFKTELISLAEGNLSSQMMSVNRDLRGNRLEVMIKWTVLPGCEDTWSRVLVSLVDVTDLKQVEDRLRQNQAELAAIFDSVPLVMFLVDRDGRIRKMNRMTAEGLQRPGDETIGLRGWEALPCLNSLADPRGCGFGPACQSCVVRRIVLDTFQTGQSYHQVEARVPLAVGEQPQERDLSVSTALVEGPNSRMTLVCMEDITERKRTEEKYRTLYAAMTEGVALHDIVYNESGEATDYVILDINPAFESITGLSREQIVGAKASDVYGTGQPPYLDNYAQVAASGQPTSFETYFPPMKKHFRISVFSPDQGKFATVFEDITERKRTEEQLRASLQEKEALLKEIHHRVKNNLTIVSSLLELQVDAIEDEQARAAFRESQARIYAMAHIHEHLYRSQNLAWIEMPPYIQSLSEYLRLTYQTNGINLATEVADVALDMDRAVPCGLIINELVSNALKHAFPPGRNGRSQSDEIYIRLCSEDDNNVQLLVSDNGVGFPSEFGRQHGASLRLELVERLTRQLRGRLEKNSTPNGSSVKVTFANPTTLKEEIKQ